MFFHKSDLAVILHSLELLSPSRARRHRGHGLHGGHGSSRLDGGLVRHEPEENSLAGMVGLAFFVTGLGWSGLASFLSNRAGLERAGLGWQVLTKTGLQGFSLA